MKKSVFVIIFSVTLIFISCNSNRLDVDVSNIECNVKIKRFDLDVQNIEQFNAQSLSNLKKEYGYFLNVFGTTILNQHPSSPNYINILKTFVTDPTIVEVNEKINTAFTDSEIETIKADLNSGFKHFNYYYPDSLTPTIITYNSAFNYSVSNIEGQNILAIGLDAYLGADCEFYDKQKFPKYKSVKMDKQFIARDCMKVMALFNLWPSKNVGSDLLSQIIYNGKIMYFLDAMFPNKTDEWKISYSTEQLNWCIDKEKSIWAYFIEKELLFSTSAQNNSKYISDAPFTNGLPQESPGRVGVWLGWQIVKKYMKKQTNVSLHELMVNNNAQKILAKSGYKPS